MPPLLNSRVVGMLSPRCVKFEYRPPPAYSNIAILDTFFLSD